jgi:hypothetical protein
LFLVVAGQSEKLKLAESREGDLVEKLKDAESREADLNGLLENRTNKLQLLMKSIDTLKMKCAKNETQTEIQRNELKDQEALIQELHIALQMMKGEMHLLQGVVGSKQFRVLRKHQGNLIAVTKPYIKLIVKVSFEAGLVSENIGKCAGECPGTDHDCTTVFYKALQFRVSESPPVLEKFLRLMLQNFEQSHSCHRLCSQVLCDAFLL